uniref:Uncharacterized protein n=1 Tax=Anopheles melas TaxID=34690 RepID=A0A182U6G9_9DIPT
MLITSPSLLCAEPDTQIFRVDPLESPHSPLPKKTPSPKLASFVHRSPLDTLQIGRNLMLHPHQGTSKEERAELLAALPMKSIVLGCDPSGLNSGPNWIAGRYVGVVED